jgi:hypothetical protein
LSAATCFAALLTSFVSSFCAWLKRACSSARARSLSRAGRFERSMVCASFASWFW